MEPPPNITVTPALNEPSKGKQRDYFFFITLDIIFYLDLKIIRFA